jgi:hypothetical protein
MVMILHRLTFVALSVQSLTACNALKALQPTASHASLGFHSVPITLHALPTLTHALDAKILIPPAFTIGLLDKESAQNAQLECYCSKESASLRLAIFTAATNATLG